MRPSSLTHFCFKQLGATKINVQRKGFFSNFILYPNVKHLLRKGSSSKLNEIFSVLSLLSIALSNFTYKFYCWFQRALQVGSNPFGLPISIRNRRCITILSFSSLLSKRKQGRIISHVITLENEAIIASEANSGLLM